MAATALLPSAVKGLGDDTLFIAGYIPSERKDGAVVVRMRDKKGRDVTVYIHRTYTDYDFLGGIKSAAKSRAKRYAKHFGGQYRYYSGRHIAKIPHLNVVGMDELAKEAS